MSIAGSIGTPWISAGTSVTALGQGTDWRFNFQWTTAAGGGGEITDVNPTGSYDNVDKSIHGAKQSWDYSMYSYASASWALLADDPTGIGLANLSKWICL